MSMTLCKLRKISINDLRTMINRGRVYVNIGGVIGTVKVGNPDLTEQALGLITCGRTYLRTDGL